MNEPTADILVLCKISVSSFLVPKGALEMQIYHSVNKSNFYEVSLCENLKWHSCRIVIHISNDAYMFVWNVVLQPIVSACF